MHAYQFTKTEGIQVGNSTNEDIIYLRKEFLIRFTELLCNVI